MKIANCLYFPAILAVLLSCSSPQRPETSEKGDTLRLSHSTLLSIVDFHGYRKVDIMNPWNPGSVLHTYYLVGKNNMEKISGRHGRAADFQDGTTIKIPISRAVSLTTVHASLIAELSGLEPLVGIADGRWLVTDSLRLSFLSGIISDVGEASNPDVESIMALSPDLLMASPFENSGGYGKLSESGIPILECADYMEPSPLARAEWIKLFGMLLGEESKADSIFSATEKRYESLREKAASYADSPVVLTDIPWHGVWYVPGGNSTTGRLIADANGIYPYSDNPDKGSISRPIEEVLSKCSNADVWIIRSGQPITYGELGSMSDAFALIKPFRNRHVFACDTSSSPIYEQTPFHPDLLLEEYIKILHASDPDSLLYFKPISGANPS